MGAFNARSDARGTFIALTILIVGIAIGHLVPLYGTTEIYIGVPGWIWAQLVVIGILLGLAWYATDQIVSKERA